MKRKIIQMNRWPQCAVCARADRAKGTCKKDGKPLKANSQIFGMCPNYKSQ